MKRKSKLILLFFCSISLHASSISEIKLTLERKKSNDLSWFYAIKSSDSLELQKRLEMRGVRSVIKNKDQLEFELKSYPSMQITVAPYTLEPSFLVNFKKDVFLKLKDLPNKPEDLRDYVYTHIKDKNYSKGIELAHQTLLTQSGDCTEHAILLTALLRLKKIPARIILGMVVVAIEGKAYMHAWTEYLDLKSGRFQILDATKIPAQSFHYIPLYVIDNESMSFAKDFLKALNIHLAEIKVL